MKADRLDRYRRWLSIPNSHLERYLLISLYIYIIAIVVIEVFRRFVLNYSSLWGSETAMYMFIYMSWIGMSWATYERVHIRMNAIYQFTTKRSKAYLYVVSDVAMLVFAILSIHAIYPMINNALRYSRTINAMEINQAVFVMAIPIGMALFIVRTLQRLYGDVRSIRYDEPLYEGTGIFQFGDDDG